jgi:adenine phosphoribosyltransferase
LDRLIGVRNLPHSARLIAGTPPARTHEGAAQLNFRRCRISQNGNVGYQNCLNGVSRRRAVGLSARAEDENRWLAAAGCVMIANMTKVTSDLLMRRFRWVGGHADMWPVFRDGDVFREVVKELVAPFQHAGVSAVCGIESRGFLLGGAAALDLGVGFVAVRKDAGLFPGEKIVCQTAPDYRGIRHVLRMQRSSLGPGDRVLLVDDWIETGSQALAVRQLVAEAGAELVGCAVLVDQLRPDARPLVGRVHALAAADELPGV